MASGAGGGGRAVVVGGSLAGLLAARVLAGRYAEVRVLEREEALDGEGARRCVPQGRHAHVLLRSGELALERLFPGLAAALEARGAHRLDFAADLRWYHHGVWKQRFQSDFPVHSQSRPLLEALVRERVAAIPNVRLVPGQVVRGLVLEGGRVRGVTLDGSTRASTRLEAADLVVDASGRGSNLDRWLLHGGYAPPREERIGIDLMYASRLVRPAARPRDWKGLVVYPEPPLGKRAGIILPVEGGNWMVTLFGWLGEHPEPEERAFRDYAERLAQPDLAEALHGAEPLSEIATHRFPYSRWRHYEELQRFPQGLLPLGDSVCSLDPVFGQGMSVAAQGALALGEHLGGDPEVAEPRSFLKVLARLIAAPWLLAGSEDFRFPQTEGRRPAGMGLLQRYTGHVLKLTGSDPRVYAQFIRVLNLVAAPPSLFRPQVLWPVIRRAVAGA